MRQIILILLLTLGQLGQAQIGFEESAFSMGVNSSYGFSYLGGGVSFWDFDNDGLDDITYATTEGEETHFYRNNGVKYDRVDLGINDTFETKQVLWVDYDNDGDYDFFATSITGLNKLYENNGNMIFKDITMSSGLYQENLYTYGAAFGDIDNDGDLDAFLSHRDVLTKNQRNYLYLNTDGFFTDITESAGLYLGNDLSFCASFFDYDNDGDQDIYVSNDKYTKSNKLYKNNGDLTFEDVSAASGTGVIIDAMSTTISDYNADGWLDIYVTNTSEGNYHFRNNGDGTFTNVAEELGTAFYSVGWGAVYLDADNDADLDLYVSGMPTGSDGRLSAAFYENSNGLFNIRSNIGMDGDTRRSFANAIGDADNDGDADIIVMNDSEDNFLWKNVSSNNNNWLKIRLEGTQSNKAGIGSKIEMFANGQLQYRYTLCGEGYLGQNSGYEFFGLKQAPKADYIKVTWLSGVVDMIEEVAANKNYSILEGSGEAVEMVIDGASPPEEPEEDPEEETSEETSEEETPDQTEENTEDPPAGEEESEQIEEEVQKCQGKAILLFPNPSRDGNFRMCRQQDNGTLKAEVFDLQGRKVMSQTVDDKAPDLNLHQLTSGVYLVRLTDNKSTTTSKLIRR
ncbi:FG-GAP-like repeat-containing protein [Muriicola sp. Z0-33]|uniref:FG-GAP-like repeat-containing protein n=1 Tax=Muriicola sp. Z0-33 TaxID=2816957 RepID=UPI0022381D8D|nr:FG-GAP-like repeat-containing protein [Muriicola sp. Z0-33]MCW5516777.1 VCBS repeat-containing protein [Muriicola sp. Z0-33]